MTPPEPAPPVAAAGPLPAAAGATRPAIALSVIVPAYNEQDSILPLYRAVMATVPALGLEFELIVVDDGSTDQTFAQLAEIAAGDRRVRVVKLRRNYGQTPAMVAGIDHARGRILVTMDADLQNDPADIARLLDKLAEGYDLVVGWRQDRQDKWLSRKLPSIVANRLIAEVTGVAVRDNGCTLKAFRAGLIKDLPLYAEMHRFIPAMTSIAGARLAEIPVRHHARQFGASKYGLSRVYKVCFDLIAIRTLLVFARKPLFCFVGSAAFVALLSLAGLAAALYSALHAPGGSSVVFTGMSIMLGSLAIFLALAGMISSLVCQTALDGGPPAVAEREL